MHSTQHQQRAAALRAQAERLCGKRSAEHCQGLRDQAEREEATAGRLRTATRLVNGQRVYVEDGTPVRPVPVPKHAHRSSIHARVADRIDGFDRDDIGLSADY